MSPTDDDSQPDAVMLAFNEFFAHLDDWSYEELIAHLDSIETRFAHNEAGRLEIRRRIAEDKLTAAQVKGKSVEHCEMLLDHVRALGWTNLWRKWLVLYAYSSHCIDQGRKDVALAHLAPLEAELSAESTNDPCCQEALVALRERLTELRA